MSKRKGRELERAPITAEDMARFHRNAPAAIARRGPAFVGQSLAEAFELFLVGAVPIVGMLRFGWSADQLLLFLLVGTWTAILVDFAKYFLMPVAVERFAAGKYDDWHVWVVVESLREGRTDAPKPHLHAKYNPAAGILVDLVCGGIASAIILLALVTDGETSMKDLVAERGVQYWLAGLVGYQILVAALEMLRQQQGGDRAELKALLGFRGIGLFLLMGVVAIVKENASPDGSFARNVMLAVNGAIVATALFNAVGLLWLRGETRWLRSYLIERQ